MKEPERECGRGMSNFDHSIDKDLAEKLTAEPGEVCGYHAGYNFYGVVWFADGQFHENVYQHRGLTATKSAETLEELRDLVNDEFGSE